MTAPLCQIIIRHKWICNVYCCFALLFKLHRAHAAVQPPLQLSNINIGGFLGAASRGSFIPVTVVVQSTAAWLGANCKCLTCDCMALVYSLVSTTYNCCDYTSCCLLKQRACECGNKGHMKHGRPHTTQPLHHCCINTVQTLDTAAAVNAVTVTNDLMHMAAYNEHEGWCNMCVKPTHSPIS